MLLTLRVYSDADTPSSNTTRVVGLRDSSCSDCMMSSSESIESIVTP